MVNSLLRKSILKEHCKFKKDFQIQWNQKTELEDCYRHFLRKEIVFAWLGH